MSLKCFKKSKLTTQSLNFRLDIKNTVNKLGQSFFLFKEDINAGTFFLINAGTLLVRFFVKNPKRGLQWVYKQQRLPDD